MSTLGDKAAPMRPRSYRMVAFIEQELPNFKLDKARVMNLPALLLRNGLLQVAVFLKAKGNREGGSTDENLRKVLQEVMRVVVREVDSEDGKKFALEPGYLARLDMHQSLFLEELAVEAATWIRRLHEATGEQS